MYLQEFTIQGIKCFDRVELKFPHVGEDYSGWIVLLGGNGMGKSTLLQAMAISLVGPLAGQRLLLNPDGWVRQGQATRRVLRVDRPGEDGHRRESGQAQSPSSTSKRG